MKLGYIIVYVPEVAPVMEFYQRAFGFNQEFISDDQTFGQCLSGEVKLAFAKISLIQDMMGKENFTPISPTKPPVGIEIGLLTDDVAASYQRAVLAGAKPILPPTRKPWGQIVSYVQSIEGTLIEICSPIA